MRAAIALQALILSAGVSILPAAAQTSQDAPHLTSRSTASATSAPTQPDPPAAPGITVPAGTKIPLTLKQGISSKNARPGDPVYAQTAFPITQNDHIVIPAGTFVQGEVRSVVRPGRVKGRAQLQMSFTSMIFPNGYTILLPGAVQGTPGKQDTSMKGKEGTIEGGSSKGKDAATIAESTIPGAGIGAIADGGKGAAIGAGAGGVIGLATVLLTRGPEIQLGVGESIEMVLESNLALDPAKMHRPANAQ
ncbi:MAG: TrbI/VirB10 family protein [Candidatus Korobacteraceae bacterium]